MNSVASDLVLVHTCSYFCIPGIRKEHTQPFSLGCALKSVRTQPLWRSVRTQPLWRSNHVDNATTLSQIEYLYLYLCFILKLRCFYIIGTERSHVSRITHTAAYEEKLKRKLWDRKITQNSSLQAWCDSRVLLILLLYVLPSSDNSIARCTEY